MLLKYMYFGFMRFYALGPEAKSLFLLVAHGQMQ